MSEAIATTDLLRVLKGTEEAIGTLRDWRELDAFWTAVDHEESAAPSHRVEQAKSCAKDKRVTAEADCEWVWREIDALVDGEITHEDLDDAFELMVRAWRLVRAGCPRDALAAAERATVLLSRISR